jgi:MFS family permease
MTTVALPDRTRWGVVMMAFACGVVGMFQVAKLSITLDDVRQDLGLSLVAAGWSLTIVSLIGVILGVQAGRIAGSFGLAKTLVAAQVLAALAAAGSAAATEPVTFFIARAVEGAGYLFVCTAAPALMAAVAKPADKPVALAIWGSFVPVSVAIMALVGPPIVDAAGWRGLFWINAAVLLGAAFMVQMLAPERERALGNRAPIRFGAVLRQAARDHIDLYRSRRAMGLGLSFLCFAALQIGFIALTPTFLTSERGFSVADAGVVMSLSAPFAVAGTVVAGILQRFRVPDAASGIACFAIAGLATGAVFAWTFGEVTVTVLAAANFGFSGVIASLCFARVAKLAKSGTEVALFSGLIAQFGNLGALVGAPAMAAVAEAWGWPAVAGLITAVSAVGAAGFVFGRA